MAQILVHGPLYDRIIKHLCAVAKEAEEANIRYQAAIFDRDLAVADAISEGLDHHDIREALIEGKQSGEDAERTLLNMMDPLRSEPF